MASYHWTISTTQDGTGSFTWTINPVDVSGVFPARVYNAVHTLAGSPIPQFPATDTRLRTLKFDVVPDEHTTHRNFLLGDTETDSDTIFNLRTIDADGQLTTYWLGIPGDYKHLRPHGYRSATRIPIRVYDVRTVPKTFGGTVRWQVEMDFRIVPVAEADYQFQLDFSPLDTEHAFVTEALGSVIAYDVSTNSYYDETSDAYAGGNPFPVYSADASDVIYMGCTTKFYGVYIEMDTQETIAPDTEQGGTAHSWQYWDGSTWTTLTVDDQTESFTKTDVAVQWSSASGWTASGLSAIVTGAPSTETCYFVRVVIGTVTTPFTFDKIWRS